MIALEQRGTLFKTLRPEELHLHENFRQAANPHGHNNRGGDDDHFNGNESGCLFISEDSRRLLNSVLCSLDHHWQLIAGTPMGERLMQYNNVVCNSIKKSTTDVPQLGGF